MKKFCNSLREPVKNIIEKKKMLMLAKEKLKSHQDTNVCYNCGEQILTKLAKDKIYQDVRDRCHYTGKYRVAVHSICKSKFSVPNEIPVVFRDGSNCDYHFIIKELAHESERQFECRAENKQKQKYS